MTNKTEDRFYFGKHGQPERFARRDDLYRILSRPVTVSNKSEMGRLASEAMKQSDFTPSGKQMSLHDLANDVGIEIEALRSRSSRPGQPERFGLGFGDWKIDFRNVMKERVDQLKQLAKTLKASVTLNRISPNGYYSGSVSRKYGAMEPPDLNAPGKVKALIQSLGGYIGAAFSRPGQPERFDASSLDRKGFAAASSSPMLGKLLSEKQMPEGGWRAVETGGGALVISFEDGDVAGNFARRVASNGYSATAPVQSIGRYWNVEVKNG